MAAIPHPAAPSPNRNHLRSRRGFSLAEMMIAMTIGSMVMAMAMGSFMFLTNSFADLFNYAGMNAQSRSSLEIFSREMRMCNRVFVARSDYLEMQVPDADGNQVDIVYSYDPQARVFYRQVGTAPKRAMLRDVITLEMQYFTFRRNATNNPLEVKEVQLEAMMRMRAAKVDTSNHIISARFMMRNKIVAN
jgi:prepilin-type N-terminal cleavage/methylation domain-containing protein